MHRGACAHSEVADSLQEELVILCISDFSVAVIKHSDEKLLKGKRRKEGRREGGKDRREGETGEEMR